VYGCLNITALEVGLFIGAAVLAFIISSIPLGMLLDKATNIKHRMLIMALSLIAGVMKKQPTPLLETSKPKCCFAVGVMMPIVTITKSKWLCLVFIVFTGASFTVPLNYPVCSLTPVVHTITIHSFVYLDK
jgi:hypothetical protein